MNELVVQTSNLPDTLEDLAKFVLVGREKYNAVRAEIRAIDKLKLAEKVREQKRAEAQMISEAVLDAEVRLGQLFKALQPKPGKRTDIELRSDSGTRLDKSKEEVIEDLGFSKTQAYSFETLAENADIVEQVKAEARENDEFPTRARILDLAAYQKKQEAEFDEYDAFQDSRVKVYKDFLKIIDVIADFDITEYKMNALRANFDAVLTIEEHIGYINESIEKLNIIKSEIWKGKKRI